MKRACLVYAFLCFTTTLLSSQSSPVPLVNQNAGFVPQSSASQLRTGQSRGAARQRAQAQTEGLNFASAVAFDSEGNETTSVAVADVNGDGKQDLVVANSCASTNNCANGTLGVLLGNGDGTFRTAVTYGSGGYYANFVAVADVNGDGKLDLVVTNMCVGNNNGCTSSTGFVSVLLGNGDGSFQTAVAYGSGGYHADSVAVADVNGDGKPDLVVTNLCASSSNCTSGTVGVLLGNGDSTFQTVVTYGSGGGEITSVAVADLNDDGKPDVVVTNRNSNNIGVLMGNGDGTFQTAVTYGSGGEIAYSVEVADLNGDGKPDLVVANFEGAGGAEGQVGVLMGNGDGTFQTAVSYDAGQPWSVSVAVADVNGDGKPDLVVEYYGFNTVGVLLGNGDGTFQTATRYGTGGGDSAMAVAVGDINGDDKPDVLVANGWGESDGDGSVGVLINTSVGPTTTALASSPNPSNLEQVVIFTATVTPAQFFKFQPMGTVTFTYGNTTLCNSVTPVDGVATCSYSTLPAGIGIVVAAYSGDANFAPSSGTLTQTVNKPTTTTTLTSSLSPSKFNQQVPFTATVTGQFGGTPTGAVTFTYGGTTLCNAATLSGGTASCVSTSLPVGSDLVTANYSGDSNFSGSSGSLTQTVNEASTTLMLVSSLNPSGLDSPVTFTATITPQYAGQASGTLTFKDGGTTLGSVAVGGNAASLTTSALAVGTRSITASYSGDSNFTGSTSNTLSQVVNKATTATTLASSVNPSVQGKPVTFTAAVSSLAGTPTGKIQFLNGSSVLATVTLTSGSAKYATSKLPAGANSITAVYEGDSKNSGSTAAPLDQFVQTTTITALTSSPTRSAYGEDVIFIATVNSSVGTPPNGETISFMNGKTVLGTEMLSGGSASFTTSTLKVGTTAVTAVYGGDSTFGGSTSKADDQVVNKATTTTALASSLNPSTVGESVTFTVTVTPQFSGTPIGNVVFKDGTKTLKTVALSGGTAEYTTSTLTSGSHTITATYNGSASFDGSTSAPLTQAVN